MQAFISPSLNITWILSCREKCIVAPALVSAASPSGAETVLESVAVDWNHFLSLSPRTFINSWILTANSSDMKSPGYSALRVIVFSVSFRAPNYLVFPLFPSPSFILFLHLSLLTLFSSCWSTLCQPGSLFPLAVILLCLHLSDKTCPTSYITRSYSAIYLFILPVAIQHIPVSQHFNMFHTPRLNSSSAVPWIERKLYDVIWKIIFPVKSPLCRCKTDQV